MNLSYRARRRIKRITTAIVVMLVLGLVGWLCWVIWLGRYIVYIPGQGARLDFDLPPDPPVTQNSATKDPLPDPFIVYDDPDMDVPLPPTQEKPTSISGYYIDVEDLKSDIPALKARLESLPDGTAVLLDLKNTKGHFYYSSDLGKTSTEVDIAQMDELIDYLLSSDLYVIGRVPAFRDWYFGLNNVPCGLPKKGGGGALWLDDSSCYWLDPTAQGTLDYLTEITMELRLMGFDEIVFTDFRFPYTESIVFEGDKDQAIADAAATLVNSCATDRFFVSFMSAEPTFALPAGSSRLYLSDIAAADIHTVVDQAVTTDPAVQLLFFTTTFDDRFDEYCVLRPLDSAH